MNNKDILVAFLLISVMGIFAMPTLSEPVASKSFTAHLSGGEEVPPVSTLATGDATFDLNTDGTELHYKLTVANIENASQAHIHLGAPGTNGTIVVWLYPRAPPPKVIPGRFDGVLAEGTITSADLVGPLAGKSLGDLVNAMESGNTYANVHTEPKHPAGEIRGQIRVLTPEVTVPMPGVVTTGIVVPGREVPIPEFPLGVVLPAAGIMGMVLLLFRRNK